MVEKKSFINCTLVLFLLISLIFCNVITVNAENADNHAKIDDNKKYVISCEDKIKNKEILFQAPSDEYIYSMSGKELKSVIRQGNAVEYDEEQKAVLFSDSTEKWDLNMINFDAAETRGYLGEGIVIGVLDSGIEATHEDLAGNILEGYNVFTEDADTTDDLGHGTKVAGMIVGLLNGKGTNGVAPKAKIVPIKCFDSKKSTYSSTLAKAVYAAVDDFNCDVLNMSLGINEDNREFRKAIDYAVSKGVVICAAAGNGYLQYSPKTYYPAAYDEVISVSSVDKNGVIAKTSQRNGFVTVAAPGDSVYSTCINNSYGRCSGTSFATPLVCGIVADMLSIKKDLSNEAVIKILTSTATDKGDMGFDPCYGYGLVNLIECIEAVADNECISFVEKSKYDYADVSIINLRDSEIKDRFILGNYNNQNRLVNVKMTDISIKPYDMLTLTFENMNEDVFKCFFLNKSFSPEIGFNLYK